MIEIESLCKSFGANNPVLKNVSLNIDSGEIYGIIGKSGAGKSTLLRCINGLETFDGGKIIVNGTDISALKGKQLLSCRKNMGMIFQQFSLLSRLNVYENVAFPMKLWKMPDEAIEKRVKYLLDVVGLSEKISSFPSELSGGQKQRVAIARALTMNPDILLCDEATSALDPNTAESIFQLLKEINSEMGVTMVCVTHQMSMIKSCCDNMAILEDGRIVKEGNVEEVFIEQSAPLLRLLGASDITLPESGINIKIMLTGNDYDRPIISEIARDYQVDIRVCGGESENFKHNRLSTIYVNVSEKDSDKVTEHLTKSNIRFMTIDNRSQEG